MTIAPGRIRSNSRRNAVNAGVVKHELAPKGRRKLDEMRRFVTK